MTSAFPGGDRATTVPAHLVPPIQTSAFEPGDRVRARTVGGPARFPRGKVYVVQGTSELPQVVDDRGDAWNANGGCVTFEIAL